MMRTFLLTFLALALASQAQIALTGPRPVDGWLLYPAAIALFGLAIRRQQFSRAASGRMAEPVPSAVWPRTRRFWIFLGVSAMCSLLALAAFLAPPAIWFGWVLHSAAVITLIVAFAGTTKAFTTAGQPLTSKFSARVREWTPLGLVLLAGLVVRVWQNDQLPAGLMGDEALYGMVARRILHEPGFTPAVYMEYIQRPPHFAYLVALAFQVFGDGAAALRLIPALFGLAGMVAAYFLFNRWFGRQTYAGLIAAALLAVMRYDLTFSRIAIDGISTPFFVMLTLLFLDRGLERKQLVDFAAAGMTLGFGLQFYLPMRIFILLVCALGLGFVAVALLRDGRTLAKIRGAWQANVRPFWPHLFCLALGLFVVAGPLAEDALREPDVFFERHYSASIFFEPEEPDFVKRLWNNTARHLAMFNGPGDRFGRDNLPGAPMLDPLLGILAALGLGLALARWRDTPNLVMLAIFAGMLQAGILSWDKEAPDALRSIGVLPAVVYFAVLALTALGHMIVRLAAAVAPPNSLALRLTRPALAGGFVLLMLGIAWGNFEIYFNQQMRNTEVWAVHDMGATWIGQEMARLGPGYDYRIAPVYFGRPTIGYLAPGVPTRVWGDGDSLTSAVPLSRPAVLFLDYWHQSTLAEAQHINPNVVVKELSPPLGGPTYVYEVILDLDTLRAAQHR
jgi:dolichyl-phosphate-mannose-protein mannosyltransferase